MMKTRHRAREIALQILYQYDLNATGNTQPTISRVATSDRITPIIPVAPLAPPPMVPKAPQAHEVLAALTNHFTHFAVPEELRGFIAQLVAGTLAQIPVLDETLEKHASNWKVARMSSVDRSLLRMSTFEMVHLKDTPSSIVIDEAIELAKQFGTEDSPSFINGILDSIRLAETAVEST